ncbi:hypothetical protein [Mucilaginibacter agri]|uniref:Uncharacterized protein n=1 Tax=Mucilaginibacter agri TaxID=2695265 RepID=A0A965ZIN4_9SPHI|nr:hypothetical protein [Mucilaginibacter agri]NCD70427.1 hypothetical protein [Mucilaginibacter agri]
MKRSTFFILLGFLLFVVFIFWYYAGFQKKHDSRTLAQVVDATKFDKGVADRLPLYDSLSKMILLYADSLMSKTDNRRVFSIDTAARQSNSNKRLARVPNFKSIKTLWEKIGGEYLTSVELDRVYQQNDCAIKLNIRNGKIELKSGNYSIGHWLVYKTFPEHGGRFNKDEMLSPDWRYGIIFTKKMEEVAYHY